MKLSVIVTVYNREAVLRRCVDSILAQNMTDYEVILVDDGSRDGSRRIMETYERSHPERIRCLYRENGGVARARNAGLAAACGEYITYVDSDDWLPENVLGQLERKAEQTQADILLYDAWECMPDGSRRLFPPFYDTMRDTPEGSLPPRSYILARPCPWNQWTRRRLFAEVFGEEPAFPEGRIYEDLGTMPCLANAAERIFYVKIPAYCYYQSENSIMRQTEYREAFDDIFPMVMRLRKYLDLGSSYCREVQYLFWEHLLISAGRRYMDCGRLDMAAEVADFMRLNYPGWENNAYLKRELFAKKLLGRLIQAKMWKTIQFLTKRKRTRN